MAVPMTVRYDLYGSKELSLDELSALVSERLSLEFAKNDSMYWGPYDVWRASANEEIRITTNFVDEDGDLLEGDFPEHRSFVYVSNSSKAEEIDERLRGIEGLEHLRTEWAER